MASDARHAGPRGVDTEPPLDRLPVKLAVMPMPTCPTPQPEQEAMLWQAQLSSDLLTDEQRQAFNDWLSAAAENRAAWQSVNAFWTELDNLTATDIGLATGGQLLPFPNPKPRRFPVKTSLAVAASLLLALTIAYPSMDYYLADYHSATGQQRPITLSDGSNVLLNTASAVSVDMSGDQRLITLEQGEAFFHVAADPQRPFIVKTPAGEVRALGTAFDVKRLEDGEVSVTVFEHAVKITNADGASHEKLLATERLTFSRGRLNPADRVNLPRAAAWHQQRMVFQDQALADVVAELDRYRPGKILLIGDSIKNLPITGVFGIDDTDIALQTIEQSLPVKVRKISDKLILLSAR